MTFSGFEPRSFGKQNCSDEQVTGQASSIYSYIAKLSNDDSEDVTLELEVKPCTPYYHSTAQIDSLQINTSLIGDGLINITGAITGGAITGTSVQDTGGNILSVKKDFDIPHPTKEGHRLRHVCLEGPEAGVYIRGKLKGTTITVPEYWKGLVDEDTISVSLTPIGSYQELYVKSIEWGRRIEIRNALGGPIECFYLIQGERKDGEKLIAEYKGTSIEDYPGNNEEYSHNR
ncbi:hypothetical protein [Synechococcus phage S-B05]|jgi:hypothetical protein|nr:hypothetical protein [Synechococcus phage S-H68]QCW22913.1 hypothetical protein [Synechococcus phage S-B05]